MQRSLILIESLVAAVFTGVVVTSGVEFKQSNK